MMKRLKRFFVSVAYKILTLYWRLFKPHTHGVKALVWCDGNILLVRHSYGGSKWKIPGGGIRGSETPEEAIGRELWEELKMRYESIEKIGEYHTSKLYKKDKVTCFSARMDDCSYAVDGAEILEARWFQPHELPQARASQVERILAMYHSDTE